MSSASWSPQGAPRLLRGVHQGRCFVVNLKLLQSLLNAAACAANCGSAFTVSPHSRFVEMMGVGTI